MNTPLYKGILWGLLFSIPLWGLIALVAWLVFG